MSKKDLRRQKIKYRIRKVVTGTAESPRLTVYRSNKEIYAQLIDDLKGVTLASASSTEKELKDVKGIEQARQVGLKIAEKAKSAGITAVRFDRNGYLYHGRVKSLADAAREGGLNF
ncbi:MAG: 50S ribosomal protein L18 [Flavobacteriales bacterium]|jgi:large subunit ribosomal protein L18